MPIYAYRCGACGFQKDVLQKMSDPALTTCPECKEEAFSKQVTAAGFQLKGSGWYVTDFRGGKSGSGSSKGNSGGNSGGNESAGSGSGAATGGSDGGGGSAAGSSAPGSGKSSE